MTADLKAMAKDVAQHRDEIIERMVKFFPDGYFVVSAIPMQKT